MTAKERVLRAIKHQETDRVPIDFNGATATLNAQLLKLYRADDNEQLLKAMHVDVRRLHGLTYVGEQRYANGEKADFWGVSQTAMNDGDSSALSPFANVTTVDEVEAFKWPSISDFADLNDIDAQLDAYRDYAVNACTWSGIFHNYIWMCGFENCLVYMHTQPDVARAILRNITDFWISYTTKILEIGKDRIDMVDSFNDFGMQSGLLMSPDMLKEFILPELKRYFDATKIYGAKGYLHSCGSVESIIPELVRIGVDILDPMQVSAKNMSPEYLKEQYGGMITFHGGIDTQHVLPEGTPDEIRNEVRRIINIMRPDGGYILAGSQLFEVDIPAENVMAMYREAAKI